MKIMLFSNVGIKLVIAAIVLLLLLISVCLFFRKFKNDGPARIKIILAHILVFLILFISIVQFPLDGLMSFNSVEEAYKFQNPKGKMLFKKVAKNTAFVHGAEVYKSEEDHSYPGVFTFYIKDGNHWKAQHEGYEFLKCRTLLESKEGTSYYLYYLYSYKDNITGIFIHSISLLNQLTENTKISDSRNTTFEGFKGLSHTSHSGSEGYTFLGIIDGKTNEDYYISIDNEKYYLKNTVHGYKVVEVPIKGV